ncbi:MULTISPECIES: hypothetical protein [Hyphobacterium]|uniref:DUF4345 domain-containing protein n=1 Tax=Hyphobacterium vulgare TaxID=1736751 RepID=A0ABV6ZSW1_9PROT
MRTLITYVLAAAAAGLLVTLILSGGRHAELIGGIAGGEYRAIAALNPVMEFGFRAAGYFVGLGLVWFAATRVLSPAKLFGSLVAAALSGVLIAAAAGVVIGIGYAALTNGANAVVDLLTWGAFWAEVIIAGLAWGTVFWLREPKTTQAMEAAA